MSNDNISQRGQIRLQAFDKNGTLKFDTGFIKNTITNTGKAAMAGLTGNTGAVAAFTYLAVGTSNTAPSASQTTLGAETTTLGLARASATVSRVNTTQTNDTLQLTYIWNVSGTITIEEIGIFNASSSGIMLGRALTTSKALVNGDQLVGTYQIIFG